MNTASDIESLYRQKQWLKAAGRDDLLEKEPTKLTVSYRFCSRHFAPSSTRNRYLGADAVPNFYVPGSSGTGEGNKFFDGTLRSCFHTKAFAYLC